MSDKRPDLKVMSPTLRISCSKLGVAEGSNDIRRIKELAAEYEAKTAIHIEVTCIAGENKPPASIEIMSHADHNIARLGKEADQANDGRSRDNPSSHGRAVEARTQYDNARSEARALALRAVDESGIGKILHDLQLKIPQAENHWGGGAPILVRAVEVNKSDVHPQARR